MVLVENRNPNIRKIASSAGWLLCTPKRNITFEYMGDTYQGIIIRSPYSRDEDEDRDEAEKLKKKG